MAYLIINEEKTKLKGFSLPLTCSCGWGII